MFLDLIRSVVTHQDQDGYSTVDEEQDVDGEIFIYNTQAAFDQFHDFSQVFSFLVAHIKFQRS